MRVVQTMTSTAMDAPRRAPRAKALARKDLDSRLPPRVRRSACVTPSACLTPSPAYSPYQYLDTLASYHVSATLLVVLETLSCHQVQRSRRGTDHVRAEFLRHHMLVATALAPTSEPLRHSKLASCRPNTHPPGSMLLSMGV